MNKITTGGKLAKTFRPFLSPGVQPQYVDETVESMGRAIDNTYKDAISLLEELDLIGIVTEISVDKFNSIVQKARMRLAQLK